MADTEKKPETVSYEDYAKVKEAYDKLSQDKAMLERRFKNLLNLYNLIVEGIING